MAKRTKVTVAKCAYPTIVGTVELPSPSTALAVIEPEMITRSDGTTVLRWIDDAYNAIVPKAVRVARQRTSPSAAPSGPRLVKGMSEALQGIIPPLPDFSAPTHKPHRKKLAEVQKLVEARDLDGLRAYSIKPVSSSPIAIMRYRDCAIKALEVQFEKQRNAA